MSADAHICRGLRGAPQFVLYLHRHGEPSRFIRVELRPDDLADLRPAAHSRVGQKDAALSADIEKSAVAAHVDDREPCDLPFLHARRPHARRQAMLGIEVEEHFDLFSDGKLARLLCLVQQDVVRCTARLSVKKRAEVAETRDAKLGDRTRSVLPALFFRHHLVLIMLDRRIAP